MKLPRIAIENHQFTVIMTVLLVLSGVASFLNMPRSEDPQISPPGSSVIIVMPGASPEDMETLVVDPLEETINELEDIKKFDTSIDDGLAVLQIEFTSGSDPDDKYSDVLQKVNRAREELPDEVLALDVIKWSISDVQILQTALVSDSASYRTLEQQAEILQKKLERVPGVKRSDIFANPQQQVTIDLDLRRLAELRIPLQQVIEAIQYSNANIPAGSVNMQGKKFNVRTSGSYENLEEIENTVIHARAGNPVLLRDVAGVRLDYEEQKYIARHNGTRAVFVTILQNKGTNIFDIREGVESVLEEFIAALPAGISLEIVFDQSESVAERLNVFFSNLGQGVILVGLVIFLAFGLNMSLIIALAIPLSIVIAVGFVDLTGYALQQMSIVAMVIALGLLVDNAIVVTENIQRFMRQGMRPVEAAVKGVSQVGWAVVSSTVTTILAFVPLMMLGSTTGDFIRSMPVTVVYILTASLFLALTLVPYLSSRFLKADPKKKDKKALTFMQEFVDKRYSKTLDTALRYRGRVIIATLIVFIVSLAIFPLVGVSFFPKAEKPQFMVNIFLPKGNSLEKTDAITNEVEAMLAAREEVAGFTSNVGHSNPRIYYNIWVQRETPTFAQIYVTLKNDDMEMMARLLTELREQTAQIPGARIEVKEFEQGPPVEAPIAIKVLGENLSVLERIAGDVEQIIASQEGTININNPLLTAATDLDVKIDPARTAISGLSVVQVDRAVRTALAGIAVSGYQDKNGKDYDIVLRQARERDAARMESLQAVTLVNSQGEQVPLRQVADIRFKKSPSEISHFKTQRSVTVKSDVMQGYNTNEITQAVIGELEQYDWPAGYSFYVGGELESTGESFGGLMKAVMIALVAIFGVLVLQFRSFVQPLIVFSAIPLAVTGAFFALLVTGFSFSFTAGVGLTSLVGIVINNSIILVDYTNQLRAGGKGMMEALKEAGQTRFVPIVLTTLTTIGGLLPLTLGGGTLWAPMGWAIIGGLAFSAVLTLVVVPVLYMIYTPQDTEEKVAEPA